MHPSVKATQKTDGTFKNKETHYTMHKSKAWPHHHMMTPVTKVQLASRQQIPRRRKGGGTKKNLPRILKQSYELSLAHPLLAPHFGGLTNAYCLHLYVILLPMVHN